MIKNPLVWLVLAVALMLVMLYVISVMPPDYRNRREKEQDRIAVERLYSALVNKGLLEMPPTGLGDVLFSSHHGGSPYAIWFYRGNAQKEQFRYFAYKRRDRNGECQWFFQDTKTKKTVDAGKLEGG